MYAGSKTELVKETGMTKVCFQSII